MKNVFTSLLLLCFSLGYSQIEKEDMTIIRAVFSKEKKVLAKDYMNFTNPNDKFWAVYDEYEKERSELSFERLGILRDYTDNYNDLTEKEIEGLVARLFKNDAAFVDLLKKYYKKAAKVSGAKNAAKFVQLENYLQTVVRKRTMDNVPYIDELN